MPRTADAFGAPFQAASGGRGREGLGLTTPELVRSPRIDPFVDPAVTEPVVDPKIGSPLNTLYGVDTESFLTDDQRKLARMIQGRFDSSMNRRDRELQRYGSPMLSSYAEDEALARAMASARGLNFRPDEVVKPDVGFARPSSSIPRGGGITRTPTPPEKTTPEPTDAQNNAQWQRILTGLTSLIPLLFGRDAFGNFLNKGAFQWGKELLFGKNAASVSDQAFEELVRSGGLPNNGAYVLNPITGMPMAPGQTPFGPPSPDGLDGGASGYGPDPGGWDSGYWYPDTSGFDWTADDPFGIGGW